MDLHTDNAKDLPQHALTPERPHMQVACSRSPGHAVWRPNLSKFSTWSFYDDTRHSLASIGLYKQHSLNFHENEPESSLPVSSMVASNKSPSNTCLKTIFSHVMHYSHHSQTWSADSAHQFSRWCQHPLRGKGQEGQNFDMSDSQDQVGNSWEGACAVL